VIEACGCKGMRCGGRSAQHANYIVNEGGAARRISEGSSRRCANGCSPRRGSGSSWR
jgi:hypothetical protein